MFALMFVQQFGKIKGHVFYCILYFALWFVGISKSSEQYMNKYTEFKDKKIY